MRTFTMTDATKPPIQWNERTFFLINPDKKVRRQLALVTALMVLLVGFLVYEEHQTHNREIKAALDNARPVMEQALATGNLTAGTWLALHYGEEFPGLLQKQADGGDPLAMYVVGALMLRPELSKVSLINIDQTLTPSQREAIGMDFVRKAAAAGNPNAVSYLKTLQIP